MTVEKRELIVGTMEEILGYFKDELNYFGGFLAPRPPDQECTFDFGKLEVPRQLEEISKLPYSSGIVFYAWQSKPRPAEDSEYDMPEIDIHVKSVHVYIISQEMKEAIKRERAEGDKLLCQFQPVKDLFPELKKDSQ